VIKRDFKSSRTFLEKEWGVAENLLIGEQLLLYKISTDSDWGVNLSLMWPTAGSF
jgi:hypothetical protein